MPDKRSGQALIVALLIVVVITTIVLALISRTVVDINLSTTSERSTRAFNAADAGIEDILQKASAGLAVTDGQAGQVGEMQWVFTQQEAGATVGSAFVWPKALVQDEVAQVVFSSDNSFSDGLSSHCTGLKLYWGTEASLADPDFNPALEAIFIYNDGGYQVKRYAFDPNAGRTSSNYFTVAATADEVVNTTMFEEPMKFKYNATVSTADFGDAGANEGIKILRMKLLYNGGKAHYVAVMPQGEGCFLINQAEGGAAGVVRARGKDKDVSATIAKKVFISRPVLPSIFDYVLFSGGSIQKLSNP